MIEIKNNNDNIDSIKDLLQKTEEELKLCNFLFDTFHESVEKIEHYFNCTDMNNIFKFLDFIDCSLCTRNTEIDKRLVTAIRDFKRLLAAYSKWYKEDEFVYQNLFNRYGIELLSKKISRI